ncbi:ATP-binding protein [Demequina sp. NBRC 110053]|uniref:ATP-binding protein n=1 Tax=Demequina sp. NBRC 110053 TaxID=1570342 RepID=UPI00118607BD|nr:ATP-binding protein [Demequina sp. NBRC 110053]
MAVPILVLVLAAAFITYGASQDLSAARNSQDLVETLDTTRGLEAALQDERWAGTEFVDIVQGVSNARVLGQNDTDEAVDAAVADLQAEDASELVPELYAALGVSGPDDPLFAAQRAVTLGAPAEEGGWLTFPAEDEVAAMQDAYTATQAAVAAVAEDAPATVGGSFTILESSIGYERDTAARLFTEPVPLQAQVDSSAADVDRAIAALLGSTARLEQNEDNAAAVAALSSGEAAIANLESVRTGVRAAQGNVATYSGFYRSILLTIVGAADDIAVAMTDREVVAALQAYGDLDALVENMEFEKSEFEKLIRAGTFQVGESTEARNLTVRTDLTLEEAQDSSAAIAGVEPVPDFGASVGFDGSLDQQSYESVRAAVIRGTDTDLAAQSNAQWAEQVDEELAVYEPLREDLWNEVEDMVAADAGAALTQAILTAIVAVLVVVASIIIALLIARRIINPLRRLTTTATAVRQELPRLVERVAMPGEQVDVSEVQITVESRDEIGTLAEAFNGVNAATLSIAAEQAALRGSISEMFVNVARRDQVLLNRQLKSIDEMERTEDDPDTLTRLFALDHLATRMRRNSESLLVLAGIDTGRRLRRPMPLSDVIRTASSEIELYERVQLELDADPSMLGHSALTAAHLFAELLENATVFSDPGTQVVVRTRHIDGTYVVEIEDSGIGMTESELAEANNRVASSAASEILGAQRLGLFVVGRIARRVGARVSIASQENKGTVATVTMPQSLFVSEESVPEEHISGSAVDAATHAPAALVSHDAADEISELPSRATAAPAYTPTVIEEGASLLAGRGAASGPATTEQEASPQPQADPNSIEALIAADAAAAPSGEQSNPADLTEGTTGAGLPTRRRREAPAPADAEREQQSIVGLPATATDEQLSALEAEQAGGFTPAVSPSELAPQSAEERASMFRGFRSRRSTEDEAPVDPEQESLGHAARRGGLDASALAAANEPAEPAESAAPAEPELTIPSLEPDDAPSPEGSADGEGADADGSGDTAIAAGATAFGAAAFFGARAAEDGGAPSSADAHAADANAADGADAPVGSATSFASASSAASAPTAPSAASAPVAAEDDLSPQPDADLPTFSMPKLAGATGVGLAATGAVAHQDEPASASAPATPAADETRVESVPDLESDGPALSASSADDFEPEFGADSAAPMVIPSLESDEDEAAEADHGQADQADQAEDARAAAVPADDAPSDVPDPHSGVDAVSLSDDRYDMPAPAAPHDGTPTSMPWEQSAHAPSAPSAAPAAAPWSQSAVEHDAPAAPVAQQPAPGFAPAAPGFASPAPEPVAEPVAAAEPVDAERQEELAAPGASSAPSPGARSNPSLDDLIQSAVDHDAEERPGFFARLFGRGNRKATGAAPLAQPSAPPASSPHAFSSVTSTPEPASAQQVPSVPSAPVAFAPQTPSVPEAAGPRDEQPAPQAQNGFAFGTPQPAPEATSAPQAPSVPSAPVAFAPQVPSAPEPAAPHHESPQHESPQHDARQPAQSPWQASPSAPTSFAPEPQPEPRAEDFPAAPQQPATAWGADGGARSFTPEQLATPAGWESAGASALQAAEPEVATSYQPVIQPDSAGGEDVTSAVFSELSSLAAERPKIEKTSAGLQRRRPTGAAPVEVKPIEESVEIAPAERDADAVRNRFSSFYSGTQRAKDDVASFERQTEPAEATDS